MRDILFDKLAMFKTSLNVAGDEKYQTVWLNKKPLRFGSLYESAVQRVGDLNKLADAQRAELTGIAEQKTREEAELEEAAFEVGQALAEYFDDHGREADRAEVDLAESSWTDLRDEDLLAKSNAVLSKLTAALKSSDAATLDADYGLDTTDLERLQREWTDYEEIIHAPKQALADRKAKTAALQRDFREVSKLFGKLDRLALQFRKQGPDGRAFYEAWRAARRIRRTGGGRSPGDENEPSPPAGK